MLMDKQVLCDVLVVGTKYLYEKIFGYCTCWWEVG